MATAQPASDQYALACLLFEVLTGASPFRGEELPAAHLHKAPPSLTAVRADVPQAVATAVARALAKAPEERFGDVAAFASAVAAAAARTRPRSATAASPPSVPSAPDHLARPEAVTPAPRVAPPPSAALRRRTPWPLWVLWPILSVGILAGVGFGWAAFRRGQRRLAPWALAYGVWGITLLVVAPIFGNTEGTVLDVLGVALMLIWIGSSVHAILAAVLSRDRSVPMR